MRTMYDGVNSDAPGIPVSAQLVAGYDDGLYRWSAADWARFPNSIHVHIAVFASTDSGVVLDVETGDATPAQSVDWVLMRRRAGVDPTVYCNTSTWPSVRAAFAARGVAEPHYWVAQYDNAATIPAGAIAKQYADDILLSKPYDLSAVADHWPGVDPAPTPAIPKEPEMILVTGMNATDVYGLSGGLYWHIVDGESVQGYRNAGVPEATITASEHQAILAAVAKAQAQGAITLTGSMPLTLSGSGNLQVG